MAAVRRLHDERLERGELEDGPVLRNAGGNALRPKYTSKRFKFFCRKARVPEGIHFNSLRHTAASWLVQQGVPLPFVQVILGHGSITTTERYAHHAPDALRAAMHQAFSPKPTKKGISRKRKGRIRRR